MGVYNFFQKEEKRFRYSLLLATYLVLAVSLGVVPIGTIPSMLSIGLGTGFILKRLT